MLPTQFLHTQHLKFGTCTHTHLQRERTFHVVGDREGGSLRLTTHERLGHEQRGRSGVSGVSVVSALGVTCPQ